MSGHSKWSNIQHRKSNQDFKKSKKFSKIIKEIYTAVKKSGTNNSRFKNAILNAKSLNIPKNTIEKAIKKALQIRTDNYKNINLEGLIHGISIIIECMTNNSIRTTSNIRAIFNKNGGRLCHNGELTHFFQKMGVFCIKKKDIHFSMEDFELMSIDFGALNFTIDHSMVYLYTDFEYFGAMKNNLEKLKILYEYKIKCIPKQIKCISEEKKNKVLNLIEKIYLNEDVENIYSNLHDNKK
ncbi:YebC/PmpR family DNA-binding transcriptional regulator [Blattabacterium sp. DPU]|uniref:YebC/PmpR family DNA-binding transcriptional regulator n=1 Tax=Blattabacterium sp. DPU TaxID=2715232 RepID=UPI001408BCA3|nr:YebC/PmpR family DNA-binding transcriptional regulator [Blattabacterium sp. DPU]QIK16858.1 YebC/PmpR family DNA-binding transcriptional regulator [Blattabacterium sp. DPU]